MKRNSGKHRHNNSVRAVAQKPRRSTTGLGAKGFLSLFLAFSMIFASAVAVASDDFQEGTQFESTAEEYAAENADEHADEYADEYADVYADEHADENADEHADSNEPVSGDFVLIALFRSTCLIQYLDTDGKVVESLELAPGALIPACSVVVTPPIGTTIGYWYEQMEGPMTPFQFGSRTATRDMILVPQLSGFFHVVFISDGTQTNPISVVEGSFATRPSVDPERKGYEFLHWSAQPDGAPFAFTSTPVTASMVTNSVFFLYAVWKPMDVEYKVVYWFEKPNIPGDPGDDPANYAFYSFETKTARIGTMVDFTDESASDITGGITVFDDMDNLKLVGEFHHGEEKIVQGDGETVVNVYYSRVVYTFVFDQRPRELDGGPENPEFITATMTFPRGSGTTYSLTYNASGVYTGQYSFQAKYEQNIENLWPSSWNADFSLWRIPETSHTSQQHYFAGWIPVDGDTRLSQFTTKQLSITKEFVPVFGSNERVFRARWELSVTTRTVNYWIEALPHETATYADNIFDALTTVSNPALDGYYTLDALNSQTYYGASVLSPKQLMGTSFVGYKGITATETNFYYTRLRYRLMFDSVGGTPGALNPSKDYDSIMFGERLTDYKPEDPTKVQDGVIYSFAGWYMDPNYFIPFDFEAVGANSMPNSDLTLFARWEGPRYTVTFYDALGGQRLDLDQRVETGRNTIPPPEYIAGTTFDLLKGLFQGWLFHTDPANKIGLVYFSFEIPIFSDIDLYASWKNSGFLVTYEVGRGSGIAPKDPMLSGYDLNTMALAVAGTDIIAPADEVFYGWTIKDDPSGTVYLPGNTFQITGDMTLVAEYLPAKDTIPNFAVTYLGNGNTGGTPPVGGLYSSGSTVSVQGQGTLTRSGFTFLGWSTSASGFVGFWPGNTFTILENITLYAVWQQIPVIPQTTYTVSFLPGERGTFSPLVFSGLLNGSPTPAAPAATGQDTWRFTGWSPALAATVTGNAIYVAQWEQVPPLFFTVRFVDWDNTVLKTEQVAPGGNATAPPNPSRNGYTFERWNRSYTNVQSDITVTALYAVDYSENLRPDGGPTTNSGSQVVTIDNPEVPLFGGVHFGDYWALMNLILSILGVLLALVAAFKFFARKKKSDDGDERDADEQNTDESEENRQGRKGGFGWFVALVVLEVAAILLFILTQDMSKPMVLVDFWTFVHLIIAILQVVALVLLSRTKKNAEEDENIEPSAVTT